MSRIPQLREDDALTPPEAREFLHTVGSTMGEVFNALRLLANHPQQAKALVDFVKAVRYRNTLTPGVTELAYTTASVANRPTWSPRRPRSRSHCSTGSPTPPTSRRRSSRPPRSDWTGSRLPRR